MVLGGSHSLFPGLRATHSLWGEVGTATFGELGDKDAAAEPEGGEPEKSLLLQLVGQGKCSPSPGSTRLPPPLTGAGAFVPHKGKVKKLLNCIFLSPCHVSL